MADLFDIYVAKKLSGGGGGGSAPLQITYTETQGEDVVVVTLDQTWQEVWDASPNIYCVKVNDGVTKKLYATPDSSYPGIGVASISAEETIYYYVGIQDGYQLELELYCSNPNEHPVCEIPK